MGVKRKQTWKLKHWGCPRKSKMLELPPFFLKTLKWKISLSTLKSSELTYLKKGSRVAKTNAKHVHSVPVIKCFPDLGPTILTILTILNIPCFKCKKWIRRGCRALQQHRSGGCESSEGRKGIPVIVIPAREGEQDCWEKKSGTLPVLSKGFNFKNRRNSGAAR